MLQLKLILKRNPEKNINLAKQFFRQNHGDPNKLLDYDHEVRKLYITRCSSLFPSFRLMLKTKFALMALSGKNTELVKISENLNEEEPLESTQAVKLCHL